MPTRSLPRTHDTRHAALQRALLKFNATAPANRLFTPAQFITLNEIWSPWRSARSIHTTALSAQIEATATSTAAWTRLARFISHFLQVLNMAIERGTLPPSDRAHFGLPTGSSALPPLNSTADVLLWADRIEVGENARINQGGLPLAWPTLAEVLTERNAFTAAETTQTTAKDAYDQATRNLAALAPSVDTFILDIWDTIEFNLRHEPDAPSLRRRAREWGVTYLHDDGTEETDPPAPAPPVPPTP